jgi:hypothetical protein
MTIETDLADFDNYVKNLNDKVRKNITKVTPESLGSNFLIRIDVKTPAYFSPQMPRRAAISEDNTVPRICVSSNLLGCIIGYSGLTHDFHKHDDLNGIYINKIDFDYCVRPNDKLVYDASVSDEHWLLSYNKNTFKYKPITVGKMFIHEVTYSRNQNKKSKYPEETMLLYIEITDSDVTVNFDSKFKLTKGYYKATVKNDVSSNIKKITKAEYDDKKSLSAVLLDHTSTSIPIYNHW